MPEFDRPVLLLALGLLPLLRWLHRRGPDAPEVRVSALFLWPEAEPDRDAERHRAEPDPRWRLRALIAALLVVALAGPAISRSGVRRVDVLLDESPTLLAREGKASRVDLALEQLRATVADSEVDELRVRSLRRPGAMLPLDARDPSSWDTEIRSWLRTIRSDVPLPVSAHLDPGREQWVLTDGADGSVVEWLRKAPVHRIIQVGRETENVGVTLLAVRPWPPDPDRLIGLACVKNGGTRDANRRLEVHQDDRLLLATNLALAPGEIAQQPFELRRSDGPPLRAAIEPLDAIAEDDRLELSRLEADRLPVALDPGCGGPLRHALLVHPGLEVSSEVAANLTVWCSSHPPRGRSLVWVQPEAGLDSSAGSEWLGDGPNRAIRLRRDAAEEDFRSAAYAVLVSELVDRVSGRELLDRSVGVRIAEETVAIAPHPMPNPTALGEERPRAPRAVTDASAVPAVLAALLLLFDAGITTGRNSGLGARALVLLLLGLAAWNPALPLGRAPLDLVAVMDDSLSVGKDAADAAWLRVAELTRSLPGESRFQVVRFGADPVAEVEGLSVAAALQSGLLEGAELPRSLPLDSTASDLEAALRSALALVRPGHAAAVVLASDGVQTRGDAETVIRDLEAAGIPVVALPLAPLSVEGDVWIEQLRAPSRARVGDRIRLSALLGAASPTRAVLRLQANGREVARRPVDVHPDALEWVELGASILTPADHAIEVHLDATQDPRPENNASRVLVTVEGQRRVLYVATDSEPPLARALEAESWEVTLADPTGSSSPASIHPALVVLDDVAVPDLSEAAWRDLVARVRFEGVGLLVLGGPHSFGAGSYRGSLLEDLLPVTAEGSVPRSRAAVLFLVDTSGSMERDREGRDRLALARQSVSEAWRVLSEEDLVAVSSFALEPREIVALGLAHAADRELPPLPDSSGGTRLEPALRHGLEVLSDASADQRLLVLVTDGFVPEEDLSAVQRALAEAGVEVIALAVGADVDLAALRSLALATGGSVEHVDQVARLPRLMRRQVAERLGPARIGRFRPRSAAPLPYALQVADWPELRGYMVSRRRPGALVSVESERGDPLFASHEAGAGRVVAMPAGLGGWARDWLVWPDFGPFASGLAQWLASPPEGTQLHSSLREEPGGLALELDALSGGMQESAPASAQVALLDPAGATRTMTFRPRAPGRFSARLRAPVPGLYRATVRVGDRVQALHAIRTLHGEISAAPSSSRLEEWRDEGLVSFWSQRARPAALAAPAADWRPRAVLVLAALIAFVGLLLAEERWPGRVPLGAPPPLRGGS